MSSITTYSKYHFDPVNPDISKIHIVDITHALSMLCRANGHFPAFYSVAQHSLNCMDEAKARGYSKRVQLACLLHDASEAYMADIPRPVKHELSRYLEIEKSLQALIWEKWLGAPLSEEEYEQVFRIDDVLLCHEFLHFMDEQLFPTVPELQSRPEFSVEEFSVVERRFINSFNQLTQNHKTFRTVGVDWMKGKWLAAELNGTHADCKAFCYISELCSAYSEADAILIDIPIGLPENTSEAVHRPDQALRDFLKDKDRKSSVFNTPLRPLVYADTKEDAWQLKHQLGAKVSIQSLALLPMIREVDEYLQQNPEWKNRLLESHPEAAFQVLNDNHALPCSKHTPDGLALRKKILEKHGICIEYLLAQFSRSIQEDVLDALCLSVIAQQGLKTRFRTIPEQPLLDKTGLYMQITLADFQ